MLIGAYHHRLQAKGRLAIPPAFRDNLGEQAIITRGIEPCLQLLPFEIWSKLLSDLGTHPLVGVKQRQLRRLLGHQASLAEFDTQGRITILQPLRDWAGLKHRVVIAGSIDWVEIWDQTTYLKSLDSARLDLSLDKLPTPNHE